MKWTIGLLLMAVLLGCSSAEPAPTPTPPAEPPPLVTLPPPARDTSPPEASPPPGPPASPAPGRLPSSPAGPTLPVEEGLAAELQALLDEWLAENEAPGAVLGVRLADGRTVVATAGQTDDAGGLPIEPGHRFRIGSVTKSFVAVLLVRLAEERRLDLDDTLAEHLPWATHAERVTPRQLLAHTSGIADFAVEMEYRERLLADPGRAWTARETIELVADRPLLFEPGTRWSYSNTNYVLAGLVAQQVTGRLLAELLRERVATPAGLESTYLEGLEESPAMQTAGHFDLDGDARPENVRLIPYTALVTSGAAAGGLSSTAEDVLRFAGALAGGQLVSWTGIEQLTTPTEASPGYGLGLSLFRRDGRSLWGHAGALPGYSALFAHAHVERVTAVALVNQSGADVQRLVERAFALVAE